LPERFGAGTRFAITFDQQKESAERVVVLERENGAVSARLDGDGQEIRLEEAEPGLWILRRGSEQTIAHVDGALPKLTVALRRPGRDPVVLSVDVRDARRAKIAPPARPIAEGTAPVTIRSPMPGRVVKVGAKAGDKVTAGQTIIVVEAMKMENELRATRAGTVTEVRCSEGAAVEAGQDLVIVR
jgi:biotin carboxyl carrier protein